MKHTWRALTGVAVAAALLTAPLVAAPAAFGATNALHAAAATAAVDDNKKVVVCKYVVTPGDDELLQTGNNPIVVSKNTLGKEFAGVFPFAFADGQGTSVAIGWDGAGLDISNCPGAPEEVEVAAPDYTPPTCDAAGVLVYPVTAAYSWTVTSNEGMTYLDAVAKDDFTLTGTTHFGPYALTQLAPTDPRCLEVVPLPALFDTGPVLATCDEDGALPVLPELENVTLAWNRVFDGPGTYVLTATAVEGYTFPDGTIQKQRDFVVAPATGVYQSEDPEADCYLEAEPVAVVLATPEINDPCGVENDFADLPEDTTGVTYFWLDEEDDTELDVIAEIAPGYFVDGEPEGWVAIGEGGAYLYEQADFTDVACPVVPTVDQPAPPATTPTGSLAVTGGLVGWGPLGAGIALLLAGVLALIWRRVRA